MIKFTSKLTYPKNADSKTAYQSYIKNIKKAIKQVDVAGKEATVHFACDGKVITTEFSGSKALTNKIKKVIFGK